MVNGVLDTSEVLGGALATDDSACHGSLCSVPSNSSAHGSVCEAVDNLDAAFASVRDTLLDESPGLFGTQHDFTGPVLEDLPAVRDEYRLWAGSDCHFSEASGCELRELDTERLAPADVDSAQTSL